MTVPSVLTSVGNEVEKGLRIAWTERLQIVIELPMFAVFILLVGPMFGAGDQILRGHMRWTLESGRTSALLLWFTVFVYFYMQSVKLFYRLLREIQSGTLEQVYLSPLPSWLLVAVGRVAAALLESAFVAGAMYALVSIFVPLHYDWNVAILLPVLLLIVCGIGYSLIVGGLTLIWKRVEMVQDTMLTIVLLGSAGAVPVIAAPAWFSDVGRVFPLNSFLASMYAVLFQGRSAFAAWGVGGFVPMLVTAACYLAAGILIYRLGERMAKERGKLIQP